MRLLTRFFGVECGSRGAGAGATHTQLLRVFNATGVKTFTHECARRCLKWGDAFLLGMGKTREILAIVREV